MKSGPWQWLKAFPGLLAAPRPEPLRQAERIVSVQRKFVLPVRAGVLAVALYFVFSSDWFTGVPATETVEQVVLQTLRGFFLAYIVCNVVATVMFFSWKRFPPELFQWLAFVLGLLDGLFVAGLILITEGMESVAYWVFPILIVLNAISIPLAMPQIVLNLLLSLFYLGASILYPDVTQSQNGPMYVPRHKPPTHAPAGTNAVAGLTNAVAGRTNAVVSQTNAVAGQGHLESSERAHKPIYWDSSPPPPPEEQGPAELFLLRLCVLWLLTFCCYGVQALAERQRRELEEAREFAVREGQLHSAGRLAAEFAHQIKNPLAVIANAAYSLQRSLRENKNSAAQQIEIIQEEVARADQVITQIMGYAQLSEGRVEKLDIIPELERAIGQVFPAAVPIGIKIHRKFASHFPPLLMQRNHLAEIFVNLLSNARDALGKSGNIYIKADCRPNYTIEVSIRDDGPGIPPDRISRIFEAYYTTKAKGSGMGLAIARHNMELYGGAIHVKSEVGKGAEFILTFPAKAIVNLHK
jgi:two-component sensor histidine kinase